MSYYFILICLLSSIVAIIVFVKIFKGPVLLHKNASVGSTSFVVDSTGFYSVWISGKTFKAVPLDKRNTSIYYSGGVKKKSIKSFFTPQFNGFKNGTFVLKYYYLNKGEYKFVVTEEQEDSLGFLAKKIMQNSPIIHAVDFNYEYEVKKTLPDFIFFLALLTIILIFNVFDII